MINFYHEDKAPLTRLLFHTWIAPLIRAGRKHPLELNNLSPQPPSEDSLEKTSAEFRKAFSGHLLTALLKTFPRRFLHIFVLLFLLTILGLLRPLLLRELIGRFSHLTGTPFKEFFSFLPNQFWLASFTIGCFLTLALLRSHFLRYSFKLTWSIPGLLRYQIYQKLLKLNHQQRSRLTTGEYVNIATRDCDTMSFIAFLLDVFFYPLSIAAYCAMLVSFLGPWALLAVIALAGMIPIGRQLERRMSLLAADIREQGRLRLGILSEILSGIRVIKFHAWEENFAKRVLDIRNKEVGLMRQRARVAARHSALSSLLPIVTGASVVVIVAWLDSVPSTANVFASLTVITALVGIFSEIPDIMQNVSEMRVSMNRISQFLMQEETPTGSEIGEKLGIEMNHASYTRTNAEHPHQEILALEGINLQIPHGQCVAIVGTVGSGKSTLISALLGELQRASGSHHLPNWVAYAPQIPWNQNASVKENIVFELPWNPKTCEAVVFASALTRDLQQWPGGIESEVGERGINLSGGQKQRLALARTLYSALEENIQTIIWDDPFSALDESVAQHIFEQALEKLLQGRTRIFCTHRIDFALRADHVLVMSNGHVVEQGSPEELLAQGKHFAHFVDLHHKTRGNSAVEESQHAQETSSSSDSISEGKRLISDEKITLPVFNKTALKVYLRALAPTFGLFGVIAVFLLPRLTDMGSNLWLGHWTSQAHITPVSTAMFIFGLLTFITVIAERSRTVVLFDGGVRAGTLFFENLIKGVFYAPMRFFDSSPQGRVLNRFTSDTTSIDSSMPSSVGQFLTAMVGIFAALLPVIFSQAWTILLIIPAAILYFFLFKSVRASQLRLNALSQIVRSPWMSLTAETLPGLSVIRSLRAEERFSARYRTLVNRHISTGFYSVAVNIWFAFRLEVLGAALVGGFIFAMTVWQTSLSPALTAVGLTFSLQLNGILGGVARSLRFLENSLISVDRVLEYSSITPEEINSTLVPHASPWPTEGHIEFRDLHAAYDQTLKPVLNGITLKIPAQKKVGIVGRTGSGKSTLFLALTRMLPLESGMIFIDGVDITQIPLKQLREAISMIPQDPVLFSGTLRDNLDPFQLHSDEAVTTAIRRAHLESLCPTAAAAADFKVQEQGRNLSVGERQLVCLARALLNRSKILLIDEATANVDVATDAKIQQTLREEFNHCTRLVIAHRTNTLSDVDFLLHFERGKCI